MSVGAGVGNVQCAGAHTPGQSEAFSRVLDDPAAGGEVVCAVSVAVAAKT